MMLLNGNWKIWALDECRVHKFLKVHDEILPRSIHSHSRARIIVIIRHDYVEMMAWISRCPMRNHIMEDEMSLRATNANKYATEA